MAGLRERKTVSTIQLWTSSDSSPFTKIQQTFLVTCKVCPFWMVETRECLITSSFEVGSNAELIWILPATTTWRAETKRFCTDILQYYFISYNIKSCNTSKFCFGEASKTWKSWMKWQGFNKSSLMIQYSEHYLLLHWKPKQKNWNQIYQITTMIL